MYSDEGESWNYWRDSYFIFLFDRMGLFLRAVFFLLFLLSVASKARLGLEPRVMYLISSLVKRKISKIKKFLPDD